MFSPIKQWRMTERVDFLYYLGKKNAAEDHYQNLHNTYFSTQNPKALVHREHWNDITNPV